MAEDQRPQHRAGEIGAAGEADLLGRELQRRALLQARAATEPDQRHLEPVEYPGDAERDDDQPVETAPRQAVEAGRDVGQIAVHGV